MLRLVEYQPTRIALSADDLATVLRLTKAAGDNDRGVIESVTPTTTPSVYELRPGPFVGRLGLPSGQTLDIDSRFGFAALLELLQCAHRLPVHTQVEPAEVGTAPLLIDLLALALTREIETLAAAGLAKQYRRQQFHRPPYPGALDVRTHLARHAGREDRLATVARRLTNDTDCNQALATALDRLTRLPLSATAHRQVRHAGTVLHGIRCPPLRGDDIRRIPLDRLTSRYRPALALAALVCEGAELAPIAGGLAGGSVLFNMAKIWEACVARWVRNTWPDGYSVTTEHPFTLTDDGRLHSRADVVVTDGADVVTVYDAKYKPTHGWPHRADVNQMVAYCLRLGISEATLVHPYFTGDTVTIQGIRVHGVGIWANPHDPSGWGHLRHWQPDVLAPPQQPDRNFHGSRTR